MRKVFALICCLTAAAVLSGDFIYGGGAIPTANKVNAGPLLVNPNQALTATEMNQIINALQSTQNAILSGQYQGLASQLTAPPTDAGISTIATVLGRYVVSENGGNYRKALPYWFDTTDYGAKVDVVGIQFDANITTGTAAFSTTASTPFKAGRDEGKLLVVEGAGATGGSLVTTISSVTDSKHVVLAATASATVTNVRALFGTDDTAAIQAAINAVASGPGNGTVYQPGVSLTSATLVNNTDTAHVRFQGQNWFTSAVLSVQAAGGSNHGTYQVTGTTVSGGNVQVPAGGSWFEIDNMTLASLNGHVLNLQSSNGKLHDLWLAAAAPDSVLSGSAFISLNANVLEGWNIREGGGNMLSGPTPADVGWLGGIGAVYQVGSSGVAYKGKPAYGHSAISTNAGVGGGNQNNEHHFRNVQNHASFSVAGVYVADTGGSGTATSPFGFEYTDCQFKADQVTVSAQAAYLADGCGDLDLTVASSENIGSAPWLLIKSTNNPCTVRVHGGVGYTQAAINVDRSSGNLGSYVTIDNANFSLFNYVNDTGGTGYARMNNSDLYTGWRGSVAQPAGIQNRVTGGFSSPPVMLPATISGQYYPSTWAHFYEGNGFQAKTFEQEFIGGPSGGDDIYYRARTNPDPSHMTALLSGDGLWEKDVYGRETTGGGTWQPAVAEITGVSAISSGAIKAFWLLQLRNGLSGLTDALRADMNTGALGTGLKWNTTGSQSHGVTSTSSTGYAVLTTDYLVHMTAAGARTATLLDATTVSDGTVIEIKDAANPCTAGGAGPINVVSSGSSTLDNTAAGTGLNITTNCGHLKFYAQGGNWWTE